MMPALISPMSKEMAGQDKAVSGLRGATEALTAFGASQKANAGDAAHRSGSEMHSEFRSLLGKKATSPQEINKVAKDFESVFLSQMLQHMFSQLEVDEWFGGGEAEEIYRSLMVDEYGKLISESGGIGVANYIRQQIVKMQSAGAGGMVAPSPSMDGLSLDMEV
jgi:Rod binding domain-containing protein